MSTPDFPLAKRIELVKSFIASLLLDLVYVEVVESKWHSAMVNSQPGDGR
jgi:hypothetical protein